MRRISWLSLGVAAALFVIVVGCGGPGVGKITGTVTLDGEPLAEANVQFWSRRNPRSGTLGDRTAKDGSFEVTSDPSTQVVIKPGEYVVTISKFMDARDNTVLKLGEGAFMPLAVIGQEGRLKNLVPDRYLVKDTSPLSVQVKKGDNHFAFELTRDKE